MEGGQLMKPPPPLPLLSPPFHLLLLLLSPSLFSSSLQLPPLIGEPSGLPLPLGGGPTVDFFLIRVGFIFFVHVHTVTAECARVRVCVSCLQDR